MIVETKKGKLPVRYGMNALAVFGELTGKTMNEVMSCLHDLGDLQITEVLAFVYAGFKDGARYKGEECVISNTTEVGDMIDDDDELLNKMIKVFLDESTVEGEGEEPKKK